MYPTLRPTAPVREIIADESKYSRCGCGPVREIYDDESAVSTLRRRTLNMSLSFSRGQRKCARLFEDRNLTPYVKMGRATRHIFLSSVAKQAHNFIRGAGSSPEEA
ncbi:hypothetical protein TcYC6_0034100 [Trypanosoma cruzi]|nr:hypothetical protein TcYC6_0034100 [Trypanosoma cruzi]